MAADRIMVRKIADRLRHRGPDSSRFRAYSGAELHHSKLSIHDFSTASDQPIDWRSYCIIFNGEIYNFKSLAESIDLDPKQLLFDGAVLGPAYERFGDALWERLDGEFAIAIYDDAAKRLVLARDRIGAKPLFVAEDKSGLLFASEIKGLLGTVVTPRLNRDRLCSDLLFGAWSPRIHTYFNGIAAVPPGHYLCVTETATNLHRYWGPYISLRSVSDCEIAEALEAGVRSRIVGGLEKAIFLSGGVDSATVTAIAADARNGNISKAYTTHYADGSDEVDAARVLCDKFGIALRTVAISDSIVTLDLCDQITYSLEEPMWDLVYLSVWKHYEQAHIDGQRVVLTGQGNDELWAGYSNEEPLSLAWLKASPIPIAVEFRNRLSLPEVAFVSAGGSQSFRYWEGPWIKQYLERQADVEYIATYLGRLDKRDHCRIATMIAMETILAKHLDQEDRLGMVHQVESRVPLLSNRLIEVALAIPDSHKVRNGIEKEPFRRAASRFLPGATAWRPKRSYPPPPKTLAKGFQTYLANHWDQIRKNPVIAGVLNPAIGNCGGIEVIMQCPDVAARIVALERFTRVFDLV